METSSRPLSVGQIRQLRSYVAAGPTLFRAGLFLFAITIIGLLLKGAHASLSRRVLGLTHDAWWIVPVVAFGLALYLVASRWTGGRAFRATVRADLREGLAAVRRVSALEAIEVAEREDEGHAYFLRMEDGRTMLFAGQYLETLREQGFPWRLFEIVEAPHSHVFFGIEPLGEPLTPVFLRPPFSWEERKALGPLNENYFFVDTDFDALKR